MDELTDAGGFRAKADAVLRDLIGHGMRPRIAEALRSFARQKELVQKGFSKTLKSLHLPGKDGKARAADIVDDAQGWNATKKFWLMVGSSCRAHELGWGGLFGLNGKQRKALNETLDKLSKGAWNIDDPDLIRHCPLGWDPGHVQQENNW